MVLFRLALFAALVAATASATSCSGKNKRSTGGGGSGGGSGGGDGDSSQELDAGTEPPAPVRRVLQLSLEHAALNSDTDSDADTPRSRVSLIFTDETGATRRDMIGEYPGGCSDVSASARAEPMKPILGLDCTAAEGSVRLRFVHRRNQLHVVIAEVDGNADAEASYQPLKTIDLPEGTPVTTPDAPSR